MLPIFRNENGAITLKYRENLMDFNLITHLGSMVVELILFLLWFRLRNQVFAWFDNQQTQIKSLDKLLDEEMARNDKLAKELKAFIEEGDEPKDKFPL